MERDIRVQTFAVARLAKVAPAMARALAAVFQRPFPDAMPTVIDEERLRDRRQRREAGERLRPQARIDYGFAEEIGALWIVQDTLPDFGPELGWKPSTWKELFNRGKTLWNKIATFINDSERYTAWRNGTLHAPDDEFFSIVLSGGHARDVKALGFPVFGTADGRVWISISEDKTFFTENDPAARVARIRGERDEQADEQEKVRALRLNPQRDFDVMVLETIAQLEHYGVSPAPLYLVQAITETFWSIPSHAESKYRVQHALRRLKADDLVHEPHPGARFGHIHDLPELVDAFVEEGIGSHGGTEHRFSSEAWSVNKMSDHIGYSDIDIVSWVVMHADAIREYHLRTLLGERVAREARGYDREKLQAVIAAVEPLLESDAELRLLYANACAQLDPEAAERLLRDATGPEASVQDAWLTLASHALLAPERLFRYIAQLDEAHLTELVRLAPFNMTGSRLQHLFGGGAISRPENLLIATRLARAIDTVYPQEGAKDRLRRWLEEFNAMPDHSP